MPVAFMNRNPAFRKADILTHQSLSFTNPEPRVYEHCDERPPLDRACSLNRFNFVGGEPTLPSRRLAARFEHAPRSSCCPVLSFPSALRHDVSLHVVAHITAARQCSRARGIRVRQRYAKTIADLLPDARGRVVLINHSIPEGVLRHDPVRSWLDLCLEGTGELVHPGPRSEEHTSELQSPCNLVCRLL